MCMFIGAVDRFQVMEQPGDNRATQFLTQKIVIDVQRGNAASVMRTIPSSQDWAVCLLFEQGKDFPFLIMLLFVLCLFSLLFYVLKKIQC